jgi:hypothetical protein
MDFSIGLAISPIKRALHLPGIHKLLKVLTYFLHVANPQPTKLRKIMSSVAAWFEMAGRSPGLPRVFCDKNYLF